MSETNPGQSSPESSRAPIVVIGGLLSFKTQWHYYIPILRGSPTKLPIKDRFLPIPNHGLGTFPEMIGELDEQLTEIHQRLEEPVVLVGQSLGALMAEKLALSNPKRVRAVELLAGAHDGIRHLTATGKILHKALGDPDTAQDLFADSDFMAGHREDRAANWPRQIPHRVIAPTYDDLIPAPQGLQLDFPNPEHESEIRVVKPLLPRMSFGIEGRTQGIEGIKWLRPIFPAGHIDIAICPPVVSGIHELSQTVMESAGSQTGNAQISTVSPVAAAA